MIRDYGMRQIAAHWWVPLVRGIFAILFGVVAFLYPFSAVAVFVIFFGAYAFVDGLFAIVQALRFAQPRSGRWWAFLLQGLAGVAVGVVTFFLPGLTAWTLGVFIASWALITGVLEIVAAFRLRKDVPGEIFLIISGVLSIVLGIVLLFVPLGALLAVVWLVAAYAIMAGIALIALAFRLRKSHATA
jgi:uncharacterized membrane protein HdeD (DUF308 family)